MTQGKKITKEKKSTDIFKKCESEDLEEEAEGKKERDRVRTLYREGREEGEKHIACVR